MSFLTFTRRVPQLTQVSAKVLNPQRHFHAQTSLRMAANLNAENISKITEAESAITGLDEPVKGGPTAQAQKNAGQPINSETLREITKGETKTTGSDEPVKGGPTAVAQSILTRGNQTSASTSGSTSAQTPETHTGKLDSTTISKITSAERDITGAEQPVPGGPTAQAQKHAGQPISSEVLSDITKGEKSITGGERIKGGPTSTAQSELGKSRE